MNRTLSRVRTGSFLSSLLALLCLLPLWLFSPLATIRALAQFIPPITSGLVNNAYANSSGGLTDTTGNSDWVVGNGSSSVYNPTLFNGRPGLSLAATTLKPVHESVLDAIFAGGYDIFVVHRVRTNEPQAALFGAGSGGNLRLWYINVSGYELYNYGVGVGAGIVIGQPSTTNISYSPNLSADPSTNTGTTLITQSGPWGPVQTLNQTGSVPAAPPAGQWAIGGDYNGYGGDYAGTTATPYDVAQIIVYNRALSPSEHAQDQAAIDAYYNQGAARRGLNVVFDGNSFFGNTSGGYAPEQEWTQASLRNYETAHSLPAYSLSSRTLSYGGKGLGPITSSDGPLTDAMLVTGAGATNLYSMFEFQNNGVGVNNAGSDAIYTQYTSYLQARKNAGYNKIVAWTPGAWYQQNEAQRVYLAAKIRADFVATSDPRVWLPKPGTTYADALVDIASDASMGSATLAAAGSGAGANTYFASDGHPTAAGQAIYAAYFGAALNVLVPSLAMVSSVTITPSTAIYTGAALPAFTAVINGSTGVSQGVTWSIAPTAGASISTGGTVTVPGSLTYTITATSTADTTKSGTATITVPTTSAPVPALLIGAPIDATFPSGLTTIQQIEESYVLDQCKYHVSTLNPSTHQRTVTYYASDGTTVLATAVQTYDATNTNKVARTPRLAMNWNNFATAFNASGNLLLTTPIDATAVGSGGATVTLGAILRREDAVRAGTGSRTLVSTGGNLVDTATYYGQSTGTGAVAVLVSTITTHADGSCDRVVTAN